MYTTIPESLRRKVIQNIFRMDTIRFAWATWQPIIQNHLTNMTATNILDLGDHLSDIFLSTRGGGRTQGGLSSAGAAWEGLVCWYINLCCIGTRIVAFKRRNMVPTPLRNSVVINHGNFPAQNESDLFIVKFPDIPEYNTPKANLRVLNAGALIPNGRGNSINPTLLDFLADRDFNQYELNITQCKTNWNDNAQIPMLWDMIYSAGGFRGRNITIGHRGYNIQALHQFTYSFATVPTNNFNGYIPNTTCVNRVSHLSGGNFWGYTSRTGVARSIKEIFTTNFGITPRTGLNAAINQFQAGGQLAYFNIN